MKPILRALREYGQTEIQGPGSNPHILEYFNQIGAKWASDDDIAWCSAFVNFILKECAYPYSGSLLARDFLKTGEPTQNPEIGDLVILWRISPTSIYGHVGFFVAEKGNAIFVLGGNQSGRVEIDPFPKSMVLGYRRVAKNQV
jgi:uncharacterized protein (TIGR02594 family)